MTHYYRATLHRPGVQNAGTPEHTVETYASNLAQIFDLVQRNYPAMTVVRIERQQFAWVPVWPKKRGRP